MSDHPDIGSREVARRLSREARLSATTAVLRIARATGERVISQPVWPWATGIHDYAEPSTGLRIARALGYAVADVTRDYVRHAREAGLSWQDVGNELGLQRSSPTNGGSIADAAFSFATGAELPSRARDRMSMFAWNCPECGQRITDYGPGDAPPQELEIGHSPDCPRQAANTLAWNDAQETD